MEQNYKLQFIQFILGLEQGAWMSLGKIQNPITGKIERNLGHVQAVIDTLHMFREKTKGNLSKEEQDLLNNTITELELNYLDEIKKEDKEETKEEKKEPK